MTIETSVPLAPLTTFRIGGPARIYIAVQSEEEAKAAVAHARDRGLRLFVLGAGSNVLIPDTGFDGVVLHMQMRDMTSADAGMHVELVAGAGARWDDIVDAASARDLYGVENLAGIPGTLGGAAVQNIGAYGAEFATVFSYADVLDSTTGEVKRVSKNEASFAYRTSMFKQHPELVILRVALSLAKDAPLVTGYADLARAAESGVSLTTPAEVARAVRAIRAGKFPASPIEGTAGSFFKNPIISQALAASLAERYPGLPTFPREDGMAKIPLAWVLDHVLALKGYAKGPVRLYEKQPLVIVASEGAHAAHVDALAEDVCARVHEATGITIEREVEAVQ